MRFCPVCSYCLFMKSDEGADNKLVQYCKHCGYSEEMNPKSSDEALVLEMHMRSVGGGTTVSPLNEYTKQDPTLPRLKTIPCANTVCPTQADPSRRDVLYVKTDAKNLKFQYCCMVCDTQWSS